MILRNSPWFFIFFRCLRVQACYAIARFMLFYVNNDSPLFPDIRITLKSPLHNFSSFSLPSILWFNYFIISSLKMTFPPFFVIELTDKTFCLSYTVCTWSDLCSHTYSVFSMLQFSNSMLPSPLACIVFFFGYIDNCAWFS